MASRDEVYAAHAARLGCSPSELERYVRRVRRFLLGFVLVAVIAAVSPGYVESALGWGVFAAVVATAVYGWRRVR
ncbi:MAG TPA: hypothetical protein VHA79_01495 [Mycobacteriales bacterium]|nr:hypothetical protein [Mycobacteriales bacterium]